MPAIIGEMAEYRRFVDPLLREENDKAAANSRRKLHASLALLPVDPAQVDYLYERLLEAAPHEVPVIRDALATPGGTSETLVLRGTDGIRSTSVSLVRSPDKLLDGLWSVVESPQKGKEGQRLRAASALAKYDPESQRWDRSSKLVVDQLAAENPVFLGHWMEGFRPIKGKLLASLAEIYRIANGRETERTMATNILADYAADQPQVLADLLMDADEKQFAVIYRVASGGSSVEGKTAAESSAPATLHLSLSTLLTGEIDKKLPAELPSSDERREALAKRQANAAVALWRMNQREKVWPLLQHSPDPRVRSYLIHRLSPLGADAAAIVQRLDQEADLSIRRALLLSLGEFEEQLLPSQDRQALLPKLQEMYRTASDPGLHAASEWLLRQWKQEAWLKEVNNEWAAKKVKGEGWWVEGKDRKKLEGGAWSVKGMDRIPSSSPSTLHPPHTTPQWYVNSQGQTMVVIPGPVEFVMGSPLTEANRREDESQHKVRIGRTFALAATPVTKEQFLRFRPAFRHIEFKRYPEDTCPIGGVIWYEAAEYCNWLSRQEGLPESEWCYEPIVDRKALPTLAVSTMGLLMGAPLGGSDVGGMWGISWSSGASIYGRDAVGRELSAADRVSPADGGGNGVWHACGDGDVPELRGDGGVAAEVRMVFQEFPRTDLAGGKPEAERLGDLRRAGEYVHMVSGELQSVP